MQVQLSEHIFNPPPAVVSLRTPTNADMAEVMAGFLRAAASGCANRAARQKLQCAMRQALDAATILRGPRGAADA
ncbi:MAG: hypothetical protein ABL932_13520 [Terricaulis sp.]